MSVQIMVPALGESVSEATVLKWFKNVGEAVEVDEPLVELETDKVTVEVPAPAAGVLMAIDATGGAEVAVGAILGSLEEGGTASAAPAAPAGPRGAVPSPKRHGVGLRHHFGIAHGRADRPRARGKVE